MANPEDNAKNWQIEELTKSVGRIETAVSKLDGKYEIFTDAVNKGFVSQQQLKFELKTLVTEMNEKYAPLLQMRRNFNRFLWVGAAAVSTLIITQAYNLFVNVIKGGK